MKVINQILLLRTICVIKCILLIITINVSAQTYSFRYQFGANDIFMNAEELETEFYYSQKLMSYNRKIMYSNTYLNGYQNDSLFYLILDISALNKKFTDSVSFGLFGELDEKREFTLDFTGFSDSNRICKISNRTFIINIKNDTARVKYNLLQEEIIETLEQKEINGWICNKWTPKVPSIQNKVEIWVCKDVPRQINLGLFNDDLNGGVVEINWEQGVFYRLLTFREEYYDFPIDYLYNNLLKTKEEYYSLLRSGLKIGSRDSMKENIEFENNDMIDYFKSDTEKE